MKILRFFLPIKIGSRWELDDEYIVVDGTSWINNFIVYPEVYYHYINSKFPYDLYKLHRVEFIMHATKIIS